MTLSVNDRPDTPDGRARFIVAETAIPLGVQCRGCGRLHLPSRLSPVAVRVGRRRLTEVELRCDRCGETGPLILDPDNLDHRAILSAWNGDVHDGDQERRELNP